MAPSLLEIAENGPRALYEGDLAAALATDVEAKGGSLRLSDLQAYEAEWQEPLSVAYRAARFHVTPRLTAGPPIADAFTRLERGFTPEIGRAACREDVGPYGWICVVAGQ